jgi:hypothetical protein
MNKRKGRETTLVGVAGVHHVVCELSRRGLIALPTTRNTAGYDVIVVSQDGTKHANIQVKSAGNPKVRFWPVAKSKAGIRRGADDYYVFLGGLERGEQIDGYLLNGKEVLKEIQKHYGDRAFRAGKPFPYCLYFRPRARKQWAEDWNSWTL